ncbi:MAG: hypothetical protein ACXWMW_07485 [Syntrophales bacterium]
MKATKDVETAKLKLRLLKECFEYQNFFKGFKEKPYDYLTISPSPHDPEKTAHRSLSVTKMILNIIAVISA